MFPTKKFTLEDLKLANELCFPDDFKRLIKKYSKRYREENDLWVVYYSDFKRLNNDLLAFIFRYSRADFKRNNWGLILEGIISDLIKI